MKVIDLHSMIKGRTCYRSTWARGIQAYMLEMLDSIIAGDYSEVNGDSDVSQVKLSHLINHCGGDFLSLTDTTDTESWRKVKDLCRDASNGGNFLIYNEDIMERLFPKSARTRSRENNAIYFQGLAVTEAVSTLRRAVKIHLQIAEPETYAKLYGKKN